eukprot:jgi/Ulvmu1/1895/UM012_0053.1
MSDDPSFFARTVHKLRTKAFKSKHAETLAANREATRELHKTLKSVDLVFLGIGGIVGAGVFVLTGTAAREDAGPAVLLSYIFASIAAVLCALCYAEFSVDMPIAGGAFAYVHATFGEFWGWIAAASLLLEFTLSSAAVARAFTSYTGALVALDADLLRVPLTAADSGAGAALQLDVPAAAAVAALAALLAVGTRGGAAFNTAVTAANLAVIVFVLATGVPHFTPANFVPFMPLGLRGCFTGASKVFFSFLGFEGVANAAEETVNPAVSLPVGIIASLLICAGIYAAMCATIVGMVPWHAIDPDTPFATAYAAVGMPWAGRVVSLGALLGIVTSLLVTIFGQVRLWMAVGRSGLLPRACGSVSKRTRTPLVATVLAVASSGACALVVNLEVLANLVSAGILVAFLLVAAACVWRRYADPSTQHAAGWGLAAQLVTVVGASVGISVSFAAEAPLWAAGAWGGVWLAAVASLYCRRVVWRAPKFQTPLNPLVPCAAIFADVFLIVSLGPAAHVQLGSSTMAVDSSFLAQTVDRLRAKAFKPKRFDTWKAASGTTRDLPKTLTAVDLMFLGIGGIIGAGVFVLTGTAAKEDAGPAVVLSYVLASIAAILSALCYTEFAVDMPIAGGAFIYVDIVLGELSGWVCAMCLLLAYTLGTAAAARGFTSYAGALLAGDAGALRVLLPAAADPAAATQLDMPAVVAVAGLAALLAVGTRGSSTFNAVMNVANIVVILFVIVTGLPYFKPANFVPFMPMGWRGTIAGASKVFFSFLGFDCVASAAEETIDPAAALPAGIIASLLICAGIYAAMCATIVGMVPWHAIDPDTPFATAYAAVGMPWAGRVVSLGALLGIVTCLLVSLFGQVRLWMALGRSRLLPPSCGSISERTQTPLVATALAVATSGACGLVVDLEVLADLVSAGLLTCFLLVAAACLWRRYAGPSTQQAAGWGLVAQLAAVVGAALGVAVAFAAQAPALVVWVFVGAWMAAVAALHQRRVLWRAPKFQVPLSPLAPCTAILADVFLIVSLGLSALVPLVVWMLAALCAYAAYGVHATPDLDDGGGGDCGEDVELAAGEALPYAARFAAAEGGSGQRGGAPLRQGRGAAQAQARTRRPGSQETLLVGDGSISESVRGHSGDVGVGVDAI